MFLPLLIAAELAAAEPAIADAAFADAKASADAYEGSLTQRDRDALLDAQSRALSDAMLVCGPAKPSYPAFTVVQRIAADGSVERSWRNGDSPYAQCMERALLSAHLPVATGKAFSVSYELTF